MSDPKRKTNFACRKCLKGASAFLKTQIALLRVNGRSPETSAAISKLKACIRLLNEASLSSPDPMSDKGKTTVFVGDESKNVPAKALKPGTYVKNYFSWLAASGIELPKSAICDGLSLKWSVKNLDLWRPLFATKDTLTEDDRKGHRFWSTAFDFAGTSLYVNSQWYGNKRGIKQKVGFDRFAVKLAEACGLSFSPYALPGIPELRLGSDTTAPSRDSDDGVSTASGVTIRITSMKKRTFRFKG